jgi:ankyrin repeat protein
MDMDMDMDMDLTPIQKQAQHIHWKLTDIDRLYAKYQESSPLIRDIYDTFAEETYAKAKEALEIEAERLDRLLLSDSCCCQEQGHDEQNYEQKQWFRTPHIRITKLLEVVSDLNTFIHKYKYNGCSLFTVDTLLKAINSYDNEFVWFLCQKHTNHPNLDDTLLTDAIDCNNSLCVQILLHDPRVDPSTFNNEAIIKAICKGHTEIVRLLLQDERVDPSARDNIAIWYASQGGHAEVVRLLLADPRVDPTALDNFAIRHASQHGHTEIVRLLLQDERVDPSELDNESIRLASQEGHTEIVRLLLQDERVDPSARDNKAIRVATQYNHADIVCLLLQDTTGRVDPTAQYNDAIVWACENGHTEIVQLLLTDGRVNPSDFNNIALQKAYQHGYIEVFRLLLDDPRVNRVIHKDVLHSLCINDCTEYVRLLLEKTNIQADTLSIQLARSKGHTDIVNMLQDRLQDRVGP